MRIALLGPLEVTDDHGRAIEVGGARLRALVILLTLEAGHVVTFDRLIDGIWGHEPPAGAPNALQSLVSRLRRTLPGVVVDSHPAGYRLALDEHQVDVRLFDRLADRGRALLRDDPVRAAGVLAEALRLWRGPAIADVAAGAFARGHVARLTERRLGAIEDHVEARLALGHDETAELEALVTAHPLRERLRGQHMRALCAAGRRADALATFEEARRMLADELGVDPSTELRDVHLAVLRGEPSVPDRTRGRGNLPARLTSFIGREEEVKRVGELLDGYRLVTLTGPGGAGKTRLAVEAAERLTDRMPGGVWLVELASVGEAGEVPQAVLSVLGPRGTALVTMRGAAPVVAADPLDRLVTALADERLLIVLDNCEHLVDACARLVDRLLAGCPGVRVLATSREALGITGETLQPVPPLAFPAHDPGDGHDGVDAGPSAGLLDYPAVRLLADRATAVRPEFRVESDPGAVLAICRRLDGMPLAIELAAARLRSMTAAQITARLDDRFRILTGGSRTALPRHQTLRAVVDWSWDLLDEDERRLLRRLSVFAGGATLDSVEDVCGGDVLDALTGLVDKSLVAIDGAGRYRVLETIRAYGAERLVEAAEVRPIRRAHAHHYLAFGERAEPMLRTAGQLTWLGRLGSEHDNLHAALRWAIDARDADLAVRYVAALGWYWLLRGRRREGEQFAREAVGLPGESPAHAYAVATLYWLLGGLGDVRPAEKTTLRHRVTAALEASAGLGPGERHPVLLSAPLALDLFDGRIEDALTTVEGLYAASDPWLRATAYAIHGHALINLGRVDDAEETLVTGLEAFRTLGERWGTSLVLTGLAEIALWQGDPARAKTFLDEALTCSTELDSRDDSSHLRVRLAQAYAVLGDDARASAELETAVRGAERRGAPQDLVLVRYAAAELARRDGDPARARDLLEEAVTFQDALTLPHFAALINTQLGILDGLEGDLTAALARHTDAFVLARSSHDAPIIGNALVGLADHAGRVGDHERAATLLGAAVGVRGTADHSLADPPHIERAAREGIGDTRFAEAFARGRVMSVERVAAYLGIRPAGP